MKKSSLHNPISDAMLFSLQEINKQKIDAAKALMGNRYVCSAAATLEIKSARELKKERAQHFTEYSREITPFARPKFVR